ncbi:DNA methyltransferase [Amycolatopsis sp. NPDC058986]|uniref:DNA methyltransferase n=1 Tax=unclassified Amycolatopsis TaxID=2618356 RepID=UPI00366F0B83
MSERPDYAGQQPTGESPDGPVLTSVWPTGTAGAHAQLTERGYHAATRTDPALMPPAVAEHAITALTRPGDIVLDPDCGAGTTIVEALRAGRHAIGLTGQRRWWRLARTNVTATKARGAFVDGMVLVLDRRTGTAAAAETAGLAGRVDLLLTSLRSPGPHGDATGALDRLQTLLTAYRPLLRPGGHVVITSAPHRHPVRHDLLDIPSQIAAVGSAAGLAPVVRCLALTAGLWRRRVYSHATLAQRRAATHAQRVLGHPVALPTYHTALVFRVDPDAVDPALALPIPPLLVPPRRHHRTHRKFYASRAQAALLPVEAARLVDRPEYVAPAASRAA